MASVWGTGAFASAISRASTSPVTIGASDMTHTQITSGLKDGDRLIIGPYKILPGLKDGQKVLHDCPRCKVAPTPLTPAAAPQPSHPKGTHS